MPLSPPRGRVGLTRRLAAVLALVVGIRRVLADVVPDLRRDRRGRRLPGPAQGGGPGRPGRPVELLQPRVHVVRRVAAQQRRRRRLPQLLPGRALGQRLELAVRRQPGRHPGRLHTDRRLRRLVGGRVPWLEPRARRLGPRPHHDVDHDRGVQLPVRRSLRPAHHLDLVELVADRLHPHRPHVSDQHERALDRRRRTSGRIEADGAARWLEPVRCELHLPVARRRCRGQRCHQPQLRAAPGSARQASPGPRHGALRLAQAGHRHLPQQQSGGQGSVQLDPTSDRHRDRSGR